MILVLAMDLEGVLSTSHDAAELLFQYINDLDDLDPLKAKLQEEFTCFAEDPLVITTSFSGLGTAEAAAVHQHARALQVVAPWKVGKVLQPQESVVCYSATENSKLQQAALNMHKAPSRPRHLFPDVLCRVSAEVHET